MRVLEVFLGCEGAGSVYSLEIARKLKEHVHLTALISSHSEHIEQWESLGIDLIKMDVYPQIKFDLINRALSLKKFLELKRKIHEREFDIIFHTMIHRYSPLVNTLSPHASKVTTVHDPQPHLGEESWLRYLYTRKALRQSTRIIVLSKVFVPFIESLGFKQRDVDVIPHGVMSHYSDVDEEVMFRNSNEKVILFFGRLIKYKGIEVLLKSFQKIKGSVPDATLLLAGQGQLEGDSDILSKQDGVEIHNRWIPDSDVSRFFKRASVVVCPYIDASQSGVIPLAYAFAKPVIASSIGGLPEQVDDGVTGYLVNPGDSTELASKCIEILQDETLQNTMGKAAYVKALSLWSWDNVARLHVDAFNRAIAK